MSGIEVVLTAETGTTNVYFPIESVVAVVAYDVDVGSARTPAPATGKPKS